VIQSAPASNMIQALVPEDKRARVMRAARTVIMIHVARFILGHATCSVVISRSRS
jgi:hypothetical protein